MTLYVDPAAWSAHGRTWCHLVSDTSLDELHAFAADHGVPRGAFERDHYDLPSEARDRAIAAGAVPVTSKQLLGVLRRSGLRRRKSAAPARRTVGRELLRPARLRRGDRVAVVAPSGPAPPDRVERGVAVLRSWDLDVEVFPHVLARHPDLTYLAGTDAERAHDFTTAWLDDGYAAVFCARGGYGAARTCRLLDWRRLAEASPKILCGYSDVTVLHQACASQLGLVTVHGHVVTSLGEGTSASAAALHRLLFEPARVRDLTGHRRLTTVVPGQGEGVLLGGNLSLLAAEIGGPTSRAAHGAIVVLEEVDEKPYAVDRMWTQLSRAGWFDGAAGIVLGRFTRSGDEAEMSRVLELLAHETGVPAVSGLDLGHLDTTLPMPLGVPARLDAGRGTLSLGADALRA